MTVLTIEKIIAAKRIIEANNVPGDVYLRLPDEIRCCAFWLKRTELMKYRRSFVLRAKQMLREQLVDPLFDFRITTDDYPNQGYVKITVFGIGVRRGMDV